MPAAALTPMPAAALAPAPLARYLFGAYVLLIVYASLYPLTGWRDQGLGPLAFLSSPLPKTFLAFDVITNLAIYAPLGMFIVASLPARWPALLTVALAALGCLALSLAMEAVQTYLPSRVPSNLDVALNTAGGSIAAALYAWARPHARLGLRGVRESWFIAGDRGDIGLVVLGLWLFTQLNPETLLFGAGDLRDLFEAVPDKVLPPELFMRVEATVSAAHLSAALIFATTLLQSGRTSLGPIALLVVVSLAIRSVAYSVLFNPHSVFAWATPGALLGIGVGLLVALLAMRLPRSVRLALAGMLLMMATAIVNFAPGNPYLADALSVWQRGHFLNFNGLTAFVSAVWPLLALGYLLSFPRHDRTR